MTRRKVPFNEPDLNKTQPKRWRQADGSQTCDRCGRRIAAGSVYYHDDLDRKYHKSHANWVTRIVTGGAPGLGKKR